MTGDEIETPRGKIVTTADGKAELVWNTDFRAKWMRRYSDAQIFVDSEVIRLSEPYTPLLTGMLVMSATLGTDIGSGKVSWIAPYSKFQYYRGRRQGESKTGALRGRLWFERMKAAHGTQIINGAKRIAGGGAA